MGSAHMDPSFKWIQLIGALVLSGLRSFPTELRFGVNSRRSCYYKEGTTFLR